MSPPSSSAAAWFTRLDPPRTQEVLFQRPDDPRLIEKIVPWRGDLSALRPGRAVLIGFPQDEGIKRNGGRTGAALAPAEIRRWLGRMTPFDGQSGTDLTTLPPLDAGNVRIEGTLEQTQEALGEVVAGVLASGAVPVVLGGGHETAYGSFLGYATASRPLGIVNIDAHLDVRPFHDGRGTSGTPFRQAMEHPSRSLSGSHYICLGLQGHVTARDHLEYARGKGCILKWREECEGQLKNRFEEELKRLGNEGCQVHVTIDADAVEAASVPGVSAPNVDGLKASEVLECARRAGASPFVSSMEIVEINPSLDRDGISARWAALVVWQYLMGLASRTREVGFG